MLHVVRNPPLEAALTQALLDVWTRVSNAGGAVGFLPPVTQDEVWSTADAAFDRVRRGRDDLVVAFEGDALAGFGFLASNDWPLYAHWGVVKRLQRDPERRARGIGAAVLAGIEAAARDRGYERLVLTVRGGTGREAFYLSHGFTVEARLPGRIRVGPADDREELVMSKPLTEEAAAAGRLPLRVRRLDPALPLPGYAHAGDAGLDLCAREDVRLSPGERAVVPTGIAVAVPEGFVGLVHPRSGLAARRGVGLVNAPGTIDAGYRGEIKVVLVNLDRSEPVALDRGDRIAQLLIQPVEQVVPVEVDDLDATERGPGGFGSSGR